VADDGYVLKPIGVVRSPLRARADAPRQGSEGAWKLLDRYADDRKRLLREPVDDGVLAFSTAPSQAVAVPFARAA